MNDKKITPQILKGFRDFLPIEAITRDFVIGKIKKVFERFGFDPLETPALEYADTLLGKYGDEADKLLYLFEDRGKRRIGLRYDQTVPLARVIAQYPELPKPFKRYQIQPVWRAENTQKGRYREFMQCDADIVGVKSYIADAEILALFAGCFEVLKLDYVININSRDFLFSLLKGVVSDDKWLDVLRSLDKLDKNPKDKIVNELLNKGLTKEEIDSIFFRIENSSIKDDPWLEYVKQIAVTNFGVDGKRIFFDKKLVRGLDYYTGIIFEANLVSGGSSIGGGGRYDKLIGQFISEDIPAVGFALGFDRIMESLNNKKIFTKTKVLVTTIKESYDKDGINPSLFSLVKNLRDAGINAEINLNTEIDGSKQWKYAKKKQIPFIIRPNFDEENKFKLEDTKTNKERSLNIEEIIKLLKK